MLKKSTKQVQPEVYARIFGRDKDGKAILDELNRVYYDKPSYDPSKDERHTSFREGQRSIIALLNAKTNRED